MKIKVSGTIGHLPLKWQFECDQIHSDVSPDMGPGYVTYGFVGLPAMLMAEEYARRINELKGLLVKKDKEIDECQQILIQQGAAGFHSHDSKALLTLLHS